VGKPQATAKKKSNSSSLQRPRESSIRILFLELKPDKQTEAQLKALASTASKLWNEITYERRQQFFQTKQVDLKGTYKKYYEKYKKLIGSATTQQILNKNNETWKAFFALLKKRHKVNPPGYKKHGKSRKLRCILRNDQYKIDWENRTVEIKGLGAVGRIKVEFNTNKHLDGKQGRAELFYDPDFRKWYLIVSIYPEKKRYPRDNWFVVPVKPLGNLVAGIDLGINNLFAVYVSDGTSCLVNGRPLKAIAYYWQRKIAQYRSVLAKHGLHTSKRLRRMFKKWKRQSKDYINKAVRKLVHTLWLKGVAKIVVGRPKSIARNKGNFLVTNVWSYDYAIQRLKDVAWEYGIEVVEVDEAYTSTTDPFTGKIVPKRRVKRGLFLVETPNGLKTVNADVLGAYNILMKAITPSPPSEADRGNRPKTGPGGINPPNLPALASPRRIFAL